MASTVEAVQARIRELLREAGYPFQEEKGLVRVDRGSCAVFVRVEAWKERYTLVELLSPVLRGVTRTEGLLEALNDQNQKLYFGKAYLRKDEVWLAHNLLGDRLDREELIACVGMLAVVADHLDDELKDRYGGQRWSDA
ncbi:MAG: YbjN domain-containing protein [Deltaproteobacteria bacterium]|nr:YbjN domain-containing protein [Deltaproteobacteria bacterium]